MRAEPLDARPRCGMTVIAFDRRVICTQRPDHPADWNHCDWDAGIFWSDDGACWR
jgi:hypothetical protein